MNINLNSIVKIFIPFLILALIAYAISTALYIYLPKSNDFIQKNSDYNLEYKKFKIVNAMKENVKKEPKKEKEPVKKKEYTLLSNIVLKAIYASSDSNNGWIVISEKKSSQTHMLGVGEMFKEYKLKSVYKTYVIFTKGNKEYKLSLDDEDKEPNYTIKKETLKKKIPEKKVILDIEENNGNFSVDRSVVKQYIKSPAKIWNNIQIKEILTDGKIDGFKVNGLSNKSIFKKLGLKKGDIIKKVNNIVLKSYADAFKIYKKIDKTDNLNFTIIRDNQEMEIEYEIR